MIGTLAETQHFIIRWEGMSDLPRHSTIALNCANAVVGFAESTLRTLANWFGLPMDAGGHFELPRASRGAVQALGPMGHPFENNNRLGSMFRNDQITVYIGGSAIDTNLGTPPGSLDFYDGALNYGYDYGRRTSGFRNSGGSGVLSLDPEGRIILSPNAIYIGTGSLVSLSGIGTIPVFDALEVVLALFTAELAEILMDYKFWVYSGCIDTYLPNGASIWNASWADGEALSRFCARQIWTHGFDVWEMQTSAGAMRGVIDAWLQLPNRAYEDYSILAWGGGRDVSFPHVGFGMLVLYYWRSLLNVTIQDIIQAPYLAPFNDRYQSAYLGTYNILYQAGLIPGTTPGPHPASPFFDDMNGFLSGPFPPGLMRPSNTDDPFLVSTPPSTVYTYLGGPMGLPP